jgi:DNA-binding response OmpR family regulator
MKDHLRLARMFPPTLALIDDDAEYTELLAHAVQGRGGHVDVFHDSNDLLAHADAFTSDVCVLDLMLQGIDGVDLIKVLRHLAAPLV